MTNIIIEFDEKSLVLTKEQFSGVENYNITNGELSFFYNDKELCLLVLKEKKPFSVIFFNKVILENSECFEISRIKYNVSNIENFVEEFNYLNDLVGDIIHQVFIFIDDAIKRNETNTSLKVGYKYYLRNIKENKFSIFATFEEISIRSFIKDLSYVFGLLH